MSTRFLYYFFLCLCKSFKELSFLCLAPIFSAKADAKVRLFFQPTKLFPNYFAEKQKVFAFFYNAKTLYLIILYIESVFYFLFPKIRSK